MSETSAPIQTDTPGSDFPARLAGVDTWLQREAAFWLKKAGDEQGLLAEARADGWQLKQWGKSVFGQVGNGPGRLLVYLPPGRASAVNLAALMAATQSWQTTGDLPLTLKFLYGPVEEALLAGHSEDLAADAIIYVRGDYRRGRPLVSLGVKGLLEVELRVKTMSKDAPSAYSEVMPGASWLLVQAITALKSESLEVQIEDFEEGLSPLPFEESQALRKALPDFKPELAQRLRDYGLNEYIFNLNDWLVLQTQYMVPTVNVSALECGSFDTSGRLKLPATARARLDFLLVPYQDPAQVFEKLRQHLLTREFGPQLEIIQLPGAFRPSHTPLTARFVQDVLAAGEAIGAPPLVAPIGLFSGPLAALKEAAGNPPALCFGLGRSRVSRADFTTQARWLAHLFPLVLSGDAAMFEIYPDRPAPAAKKLTEPPDTPDLTDLSQLIPDFPELDLPDEPFGSLTENESGNSGQS
ncbi:MAG: peptidase dimerization domain-containing protein [Chloroflexi bacterium]|nr:peptidase dimerization domain-containing protein [Chloroflexota bacterium]OJV92441.1 MAG: hypothetical protein BGO39_31460 [Chloroflexi bacterium 54-19]